MTHPEKSMDSWYHGFDFAKKHHWGPSCYITHRLWKALAIQIFMLNRSNQAKGCCLMYNIVVCWDAHACLIHNPSFFFCLKSTIHFRSSTLASTHIDFFPHFYLRISRFLVSIHWFLLSQWIIFLEGKICYSQNFNHDIWIGEE